MRSARNLAADLRAPHVQDFPPTGAELIGMTSGDPVPRVARLMFSTTHSNR